ncbi:unnamed protein product [Mycena citricolor]|uniref:Uncharacterized protein n=1 Tax=Mycena citricolor TaxID=2018698 RepID=A0AAD2HCX3_9AGAR|nr:unnamed protein product [Mycena citricolor]
MPISGASGERLTGVGSGGPSDAWRGGPCPGRQQLSGTLVPQGRAAAAGFARWASQARSPKATRRRVQEPQSSAKFGTWSLEALAIFRDNVTWKWASAESTQ